MANIHPTAIVDKKAIIADDAEVGPWCIIGPNVTLESKVKLRSNIVVEGETVIGEGTEVYPFTTIGVSSQHLKYLHDTGKVTIGKNNMIREHVTIHVGIPEFEQETRIGDNCLIMINSHIAHGCKIGNDVVMSNLSTLAGHVVIEDFARLGGMCAIHQFCRIGRYAMVGGMTGIGQDVIPYGLITGVRGHLKGLNLIGIKRRGFTPEQIGTLRKAYRSLFAPEGTLAERIKDVEEQYKGNELVDEIITFMKAESKYGISVPAKGDEDINE